ncbi:P-loop containing nucleoside triphosphate hydrolase protein [Infundibulicybe gibba]|nr:P-loop containing nucleoside triphosphate hydrolase protein [Infundibulicybe gibba]
MPSHTAASALITLYYPGGHPWDWPVWQELTGVRHGLFPPVDSDLPKNWTREDANDIESYFRQYRVLAKEEEKIKFATARRGGSSHPGRQKWTAFVGKSWAKWGLHTKIVEGLRSHSIHPIQILLGEGSSNLEPWPNADQYVPMAIDTIGLALFGEEAFAGAPLLPLQHRKPLAAIVQRSWSRIREQVRKDKGRLQEIEQAALAAFKGLEEGEPTKTKISSIISAVARWKNISEIYGTKENQTKAIDMISELNRVMGEIGADVPPCQPGRLCKTNQVALKNLATEEDVNDLELIYAEYLNEVESDLPALNAEPILPFNLQEVEGGDLGMEQESHMEPDILASRLGFQHGLPIQFGSHRHPTGAANVWDDPAVFESSPDLQPLKLHWHQLAGVHSIIRNTFTQLPDDIGCSGVLICDDVGLGKTALAITLIGFLNQYLRSPEQPPPILEHLQYLNGKKVESHPHLIVATGTIRHQWESEMKTLFRGRSVDILPYDSPKTGNAEFWAPNGPFHSSLQRPENKVILTTPTSLVNDLQRICRIKAGKKKWPWSLPEERGPTDGTIFHQKFLVVIIDEAHEMRNIGTKFHSALRILQQASLKLLLTGTPLLTAPKDISSMARLCGVPYFLSEKSVAEEKEDAIAFRRARKMDDDGLALRKAQIEAVRRMQKHFHGSILRRTADSLDWKGQVLVSLPPYKEITGILRLTEREMSILEKHAEVAKARYAFPINDILRLTRSQRDFYLEYRATVCFAKDESMSSIPVFRSFNEWGPVKSTKMDACARICRHYLSRDDVPDVEFEDGSVIFPTVDTTEAQFSRERKILIFAEFPSMTGILCNVLTLYGVESVSINGKMTYAKRRTIITKFHSPCGPRVFIFSSVGSAGLNLSIADVVIFFDQPWSAQDERQIRGRAHRQPQKSIVKVVHLLAESSADILMSNMARGKEEMFEAFVNKDLGEGMSQLIKLCAFF